MIYNITSWHCLIHVTNPTWWDKAWLLLYFVVFLMIACSYVLDLATPTIAMGLGLKWCFEASKQKRSILLQKGINGCKYIICQGWKDLDWVDRVLLLWFCGEKCQLDARKCQNFMVCLSKVPMRGAIFRISCIMYSLISALRTGLFF